LRLIVNDENTLFHAGFTKHSCCQKQAAPSANIRFLAKERSITADEVTAGDRLDMQRGTDESMEGHSRSFGAFWSNHLKKNELVSARCSNLDRAEFVSQLVGMIDVRSSSVSRGKALIANPNYPNTQTERRNSRLLTEELRDS
jgi:hypothetical protein